MVFTRLYYLSLFIGVFSATALLGCQTHIDQSSQTITDSKIVTLKNIPKPQLIERLTYYDWELTQVTDADGKSTPFNHKPPLIITVAPDRLLFNEGCHHYHVFISETYQPNFPYRFSNFRTGLTDSCQNDEKSEIRLALERLFRSYGDTAFKFEPLPDNQSQPKIALVINDSTALVFNGEKSLNTLYRVSPSRMSYYSAIGGD